MRRIVVVLVVALVASACGAAAVGSRQECVEAVETYQEHSNSAAEPLPTDELKEISQKAASCLDLDDVLAAVAGWNLNDRRLPSSTRACLPAFVRRDVPAFLEFLHNDVHDRPTGEESGATWAEAMATCVPASYVLLDRFEDVFDAPEAQECADSAYKRPDDLLPYFENLVLQDDRLPYSEWTEEDLDAVFDPMYGCADFLPFSYPPEVTENISDDSASCLRKMLQEYHLASREVIPDETAAEVDSVALNCFTADERSELFGL